MFTIKFGEYGKNKIYVCSFKNSKEQFVRGFEFEGTLVDLFCCILNKDMLQIFYPEKRLERFFEKQNKYVKHFKTPFKSYEELKFKYVKGEIDLNSEVCCDKESYNELLLEMEKIDYKFLMKIVDKLLVGDYLNSTALQRKLVFECMYGKKYFDILDIKVSNVAMLTNINENLKSKIKNIVNSSNQNEEKNFNTLLKLIKKENLNQTASLSYETNSILELTKFLLNRLIEWNKILKKCKCCGKYFCSKKQNGSEYCENLCFKDPTKTCKDYATYQEYLENNRCGSKKVYRQIYNILNNRRKRIYGGSPKIDEEIEIFKNQAKDWQLEIQEKNKTEEEYMGWLIETKKLKTQKGV